MSTEFGSEYEFQRAFGKVDAALQQYWEEIVTTNFDVTKREVRKEFLRRLAKEYDASVAFHDEPQAERG